LARDFNTKGNVHELMPNWQYAVKVNTFYPEARVSTGRRKAVMQPKAVKAKKDYEEDYIAFRWQDVGAGEIDFHQPLSGVEVKIDDKWVPMVEGGKQINDDGYDLEVRYLKKLDEGMGKYEVRWYNPVRGGEYRFRIEPRGKHPVLASRAFVYERSADGQDERAVLTAEGDE
jgi:neutral ceramidase